MDFVGILFGMGLLAILGLIWAIHKHKGATPMPATAQFAAQTATLTDALKAEIAAVPSLVSEQLQATQADLAAAVARAEKAEADLAAERQGKQSFVDEVRAAAQAVLDRQTAQPQ